MGRSSPIIEGLDGDKEFPHAHSFSDLCAASVMNEVSASFFLCFFVGFKNFSWPPTWQRNVRWRNKRQGMGRGKQQPNRTTADVSATSGCQSRATTLCLRCSWCIRNRSISASRSFRFALYSFSRRTRGSSLTHSWRSISPGAPPWMNSSP